MQRFMSRVFLSLMVLSIMIAMVPRQSSAAGYRVVVDGRPVDGAQAEMKNGQLMVAIRSLAEAMDGLVTWYGARQQILIEHNDSQLAMWVGSKLAFQDGQKLFAPVAPYYVNGKTMGPAWWLASRLGGKVTFDGSTLYVTTGSGQTGQESGGLMDSSYFFPYTKSAKYEKFYNTWGDGRSYQGRNFKHEGIDILAPKGTPIVAVASGTVVRYGWNTLGGYRLTVQLDDFPGWRFYYAHMDRYAVGMYLGARVRAGQVIGYTGNTGEGPERTEGKFVSHLHFGVYRPDGTAVNPYYLLKYWEQHKVQW
ncbi:MAG TPA: peptidoglycan DD-metalloendopeptidase family protein [Symbiobacteriaceae bacterium]|nr:peptidoglycan DD-metalloendopeptidase family protein [Symbiobacteriaceae bacterium]